MKSRFGSYIPPLLILWLAFALRLYRLDFQSIWWDEGHSIFVATNPILQIPTLPAMDVHPPAYFALLHLWMAMAGSSEFALRYLSVIFSLLTLALLWPFATALANRARTPPPAARLVALLAAISPLYVAYAQEVRSYAMITCLALASTYILWRLLFRGQRPGSARQQSALLLLYIVLTAACLYTHYFTIFLLLFQNLVWLAWLFRSHFLFRYPAAAVKGQARLWLASQLGILLLFAPQLWLALRQVTSYTNPNLVPPTLAHFASRSWQAYTVGLTVEPALARWGMAAMAGVLLVGWLIQLRTNRGKLTIPALFLSGWLLLPLGAYFIVLQRQPSFEPRYMILVTPALFLLLALGLGHAPPLKPRRPGSTIQGAHFTWQTWPAARLQPLVQHLLALIPIITFALSLYSYYTNEAYFKDDSAGVADWLAAQTSPNDIIYIDVPHPFHYYAAQGHIPAPARYLFVDIHTAADILTREAAGRDRLFWVTWHGSDTDPRGVIPFLAQKYGRQLGQLDFRGYRVTWFSLPQAGTVFSLPATLTPSQATFGDVLRLDGLAYGGHPPWQKSTSVKEPVWATLHFTLLKQTHVDYRVSLRLRDEAGHIVAQVDKDLLNDRHFRTSAWPLADPALNQAINVYTLPLPADTPPGSYQLEAVVYNAQPPYPSEGVSGHPSAGGQAALLGTITVTP